MSSTAGTSRTVQRVRRPIRRLPSITEVRLGSFLLLLSSQAESISMSESSMGTPSRWRTGMCRESLSLSLRSSLDALLSICFVEGMGEGGGVNMVFSITRAQERGFYMSRCYQRRPVGV